MIEVRDLTKSYDGFQALKGISFSVEPGEIVGFLGPNGAGKSTTMKIITCAMPQTAGTVTIEGLDINDQSIAVRQRLGYLPESTPLYLDMLVYDYLKHVATMRGVPKAAIHGRIKSACEMCGLTDRVGQRIGTLSKGFKQRVGLAQALIHDPKILVLDEPTSGLDPNQIVEIRNLIKRLGKDRTIILSTHNLPEVMATCNRIIIIHNGEVVADGTPQQLEARSVDQAALHVVLRGVDADAVTAKLGELEGVEAVTAVPSTETDAMAFDVTTGRDHDVRADIFQLAVREGWELVGLKRDVLDLETLFRKLTREL